MKKNKTKKQKNKLLPGSGLSKGWSSSEKNKNVPNDFQKHMAISNYLSRYFQV